MKITIIGRDVFARYDVLRRRDGEGECYWCGRRGRLFRYGIRKDGITTRPVWDDHSFCSKSCRDVSL